MKRQLALFLSILILLGTYSTSFAAKEDIIIGRKTININGVNKTVEVVEVDLNSPDIKLEVVTAKDKVQGGEDFQSMINRKKPIAAINGNFFDAYNSLEPYGSIMKDGKLTYLEGINTSFVIDEENNVDIDYFSTRIKGYLDGKRENKWNPVKNAMDFYLFDIWYVNNLPRDKSGVYIYTPERGESIELKDGTAIEVVKNKITKIVKNPGVIKIPKDGYLIYYGRDAASDTYIKNRFKVGITVELEYITSPPKEKKEEPKTTPPAPGKNTKLFGSIDKKTKNQWNNAKNGMDFYLFNIWYINTRPIDSSGVYLYTPERGEKFQVPEGKTVTVKNKIITKIDYKTKEITIPKDGFVIYFGKDSVKNDYIENRFAIGKTVDFYHETTLKLDTDNIIKKAVEANKAALEEKMDSDSKIDTIDLNKFKHMISAGPYLVKDGKAIADASKEGFEEEKITKNPAQRSALGITKDNKLILVTGSSLTVGDLAQVMIKLNSVKAMNLDGGASSALYGKGKIITRPGRKLNTVLMIYDKK